MTKFVCLVVVFALLSVVFASSSFAVVKKMDMVELRDASSDIIVGRVTSAESRWEGNLIYTYYDVKVVNRVKGNPPEVVTIRVPGGEVGDVMLFVSDTPYLEQGEEVFLFLQKSNGFHQVTGWFQGKYSVRDGMVGETGFDVRQFKDRVLLGKPGKPPKPSKGYKLCRYDWSYLDPVGGIYYPEPWEINASNNEGLSAGAVNSTIQAAADTWGAAGACFSFGTGSTGSNRTGPELDDYNVVSFGNTDGAVAACYIWVYTRCRKCIAEIDMVIDEVYWDWGIDVCGSGSLFDLQNVVTHEFGHWLCLADLYGTQDYWQTMYGYVDFGECYKRDLNTGDIAGIKKIYGECGSTMLDTGPAEQLASAPRTSGTTIKFSVPTSGFAAVEIYNVRGQLVRTVSQAHLDAGEHAVTWDGRDTSGNRAASGVYFVRVSGGDYVTSAKMVLMR